MDFNFEVPVFYSCVHGMCQQYLLVCMNSACVLQKCLVVPGEQLLSELSHDVFPSVVGMASHRYPAESDRGKRVKFRVMFLGVSFSTVS